ncbi:MAG: cyclic nucleotide-binding domain-containing protein [Alphaproteobacteria bacterium]|nr:cyclic nucleotide-binding domain-containing protein [Alphaproteobacteria bacterium]
MNANAYDVLADIEPFSGLGLDARSAIAARLQMLSVPRGQTLVAQGDPSDHLYVVITGRFSVSVAGAERPVAEISAGQPVGEIAFFAGGNRTATVRAERDSVVFALSRADFDALALEIPSLWPSVTRTLATRLAETTARHSRGNPASAHPVPKTIAICRAGARPLNPAFLQGFKRQLSGGSSLVLDSASDVARTNGAGAEAELCRLTAHFNDLEKRHSLIVYICDDTVTPWTEKALHQADHVVLVADASERLPRSGFAVNELERLAASLQEPHNIRLAILHRKRLAAVERTADWLDPRSFVGMHHHLAVAEDRDAARLLRFITGQALGVVASGGGAFTAAHVGMIEALIEQGYEIDAYGGTSGGAAMTAAFAGGVDAEAVARHTHEMFVERKAMARWNWPRYSLLDHTVFDACLAELYPVSDIADLWLPYFAVATNLSRNALQVIRRGPVWKAIRASAAIPALFPPVFAGGEMLVDGCLIDNVPLLPMRQLKRGPNIILDLDVPDSGLCEIDTATLPSRSSLMRRLFMSGGKPPPAAPGPQTVLLRSLLRETRNVEELLEPGDMLLSFPVPEGANVLDWTNHRELRWSAYDFAREKLANVAGPKFDA